jgi:hypothetical protein
MLSTTATFPQCCGRKQKNRRQDMGEISWRQLRKRERDRADAVRFWLVVSALMVCECVILAVMP